MVRGFVLSKEGNMPKHKHNYVEIGDNFSVNTDFEYRQRMQREGRCRIFYQCTECGKLKSKTLEEWYAAYCLAGGLL